jgi:hypothetical protein
VFLGRTNLSPCVLDLIGILERALPFIPESKSATLQSDNANKRAYFNYEVSDLFGEAINSVNSAFPKRVGKLSRHSFPCCKGALADLENRISV